MTGFIDQPIRARSLGWINEAITSAGTITSSIINSKTQASANDAALKNTMLQTDQLRVQGQLESERMDKIIKVVMIGGGLIIAGIVITSMVKNKSKN